jgi:hypothetical protein
MGPRRLRLSMKAGLGRRSYRHTIALVGAAVIPVVSPAAAAARTPVTVSVQGEHVASDVTFAPQQRPQWLSYGPDTGVGDISWSSWGGSTAAGEGRYDEVGGSSGRHVPVTVRLDRIRRCGPYRLYTRAAVRDAQGGAPTRLRLSVGCQVFVDIRTNGRFYDAELVQRPRRASSDGDQITRMRWSSWNRASTRGRGRITLGYNHGNDERKTVGYSETFSRIRYCRAVGRLIYTRVRTAYRVAGKLQVYAGRTGLSYECDG